MSNPPRKVIHLPKVRMLGRVGRNTAGFRITNVQAITPPDVEKRDVKPSSQPQVRILGRGGRSTPGIRITNVQAIKPPAPDAEKQDGGAPSPQPQVRILGGTSTSGRASTIRITNVKTIKPPDPELVRKKEEEKLRAQLEKEILSRSRTCANKKYECSLPVMSGRAYCSRHILQDPTAPYRRCAHERCSMPTDQTLCFEHARAAMYARHRSTAPPPPVTTTETLLHHLQHYVKAERARTTSCASSVSVVSDPSEQEQAVTLASDPFKQIDARTVNNTYSSSIMEYCSASDSDGDSVTLGRDGNTRAVDTDELSDTEDAPAEMQPLWKAGVFTAEEAVCEAKTALRSLQSAYLRQMGRLRILLQTARHQYLRSLKAEKEQYCSINAQSLNGPLTVRERRQLRKLKAFASYRRKHGADAVLARKLHRKRAKVNEPPSNRPIPSQGRCTFTEGGVRCPSHVLPAAKHCLKHIIHDRNQVLFSPCGDLRGGVSCREPVARLPLPHRACRYHTDPPPYTVFTLKKDGSDSDTDSRTSTDSQLTNTEDIAVAPSEGLEHQHG